MPLLKYISMGRQIGGNYTRADSAFVQLLEARRSVAEHSTLVALLDACAPLEAKFRYLEERWTRERLEEWDGMPDAEAPAGYIDDALAWHRLRRSLDEVAGLFAIAVQNRAGQLRNAGTRVMKEAAADGLASSLQLELPPALAAAHHVANYVKHHDEWAEELTGKQRRTFDALVELGLAERGVDYCMLDEHLAMRALLEASSSDRLCGAFLWYRRQCEEYGAELQATIQARFSQCEPELEAARARAVEPHRAKIRAAMQRPYDDDPDP